jgi:hypothetical protein
VRPIAGRWLIDPRAVRPWPRAISLDVRVYLQERFANGGEEAEDPSPRPLPGEAGRAARHHPEAPPGPRRAGPLDPQRDRRGGVAARAAVVVDCQRPDAPRLRPARSLEAAGRARLGQGRRLCRSGRRPAWPRERRASSRRVPS